MANRKRVQFFNDFTGGLNLDVPPQALAINETDDCMDVDFNVRGGFAQRLGVKIRSTDTNMNGGYFLGQLSFGTDMVFGITPSSRLWTWDGSTATHVATAVTDTFGETVRWATWVSKLYLANCWNAGNLVMRHRSTASLATVTALTNTFNNNYAAPTGGNMPLARHVQDHMGHMWVADTSESGTRYRSRIRWSHALQPEDWADADYFDIEPDDESDQITALVPFQDHLLVFKRRSVWAIYGYDKDTFTPQRLTQTGGVWSKEATAANTSVVYWYSPDGNMYAYNGKGIAPIGDRLSGLVRDELVTTGAGHSLVWAGDRLWLSLIQPGNGRYCFVYDPGVGQNGAFTRYSVQPTSFVWWRKGTGTNQLLFTLKDLNGVFDHGAPSQFTDELTSGNQTAINGYFKTSWFDADDTALKKIFKRMHVTAAAQDPCTINIDVYTEFNDSIVTRTLQVIIEEASSSGMTWGSGTWGLSLWGDGAASYVFDRMPSSGRGHAIRFKFSAIDNVTTWWVDSFSLPFMEKGYR